MLCSYESFWHRGFASVYLKKENIERYYQSPFSCFQGSHFLWVTAFFCYIKHHLLLSTMTARLWSHWFSWCAAPQKCYCTVELWLEGCVCYLQQFEDCWYCKQWYNFVFSVMRNDQLLWIVIDVFFSAWMENDTEQKLDSQFRYIFDKLRANAHVT